MTIWSDADVSSLREILVTSTTQQSSTDREQCSDMTVACETDDDVHRPTMMTSSDIDRIAAAICIPIANAPHDRPVTYPGRLASTVEPYSEINKYLHPAPIPLGMRHVLLQRRPGTHHGKGGRPRGTTMTATPSEVGRHVEAVLGNGISERFGGVVPEFVSDMVELLATKFEGDRRAIRGKEITDSAIRMLEDARSTASPRGYYSMPGPFIAVCSTVMSASRTGVRLGNVMDKHAVCFWMEQAGVVYCTCYGSTRFRVLFPMLQAKSELSDALTEAVQNSPCAHIVAVNGFVSKLARSLETSSALCIWAMAVTISRRSEMGVSQLAFAVPMVLPVFKKGGRTSMFVVVEKDISADRYIYVPVRRVVRGASFMVCCFCDNLGVRYCHHVTTATLEDRKPDMSGSITCPEQISSDDIVQTTFENPTLEGSATAEEDLTNGGDAQFVGSYMTPSEEVNSISTLPVSPVNCASSISVDLKVRKLVYSSGVFVATAPIHCLNFLCSGRRDLKSTTVQTGGVLMCSSGPCELHFESGRCDTCSQKIEPEGRELYIVIDSMTTAATHAWLRTELSGVVLGNGTLTGRIRHYHGQVSSHQSQHGIRSSRVPCRSVKAIRRLATIMLKLMCMNPPPELFTCHTCEFDGSTKKSRMEALCMDGINQGHLLSCKKPFRNICEPCKPKKAGTATGPRSVDIRPLDTFMRGTETVKILFQVAEGVEIQCTAKNVQCISAVVRIISPQSLPRFFCLGSICGRSSTHYLDDLGSSSTLTAVAGVVQVIFDSDVILKRLLEPLHTFLMTCSSEDIEAYGGEWRPASLGKRRKETRSVTSHVNEALLSLRHVECMGSGQCWTPALRSAPSHIRDDVLRMTKMALQGPITQFLHKTDVGPAVWLAQFCALQSPQLLVHCLKPPSNIMLPNVPQGTLREVQRIISRCIVLQAGLQSLLDLDHFNRSASISARKAFGTLLHRGADRVHEFYSFYELGRGTTTATKYGARWRTTDVSVLTAKMQADYGSHTAVIGNCYDVACRTGFFFPYRKQIRPLPFNDEEYDITAEEEDAGYCSKNYLQRQKNYTPGCLTFVCSCSHPLVLGLKAIHRDEGPRVVLDTILSRFASPPEYLIYDFGCGLYNSARHCLWWALEDTTIVSDFFHYRNHSCSPAFEPGSHSKVTMVNTVAHEQRNRSIQQLGRTLRNSSQEFYLSLIAFQATILNLQAKAKSESKFYDRPNSVSAYDLEWAFFQCLGLKCFCCQ